MEIKRNEATRNRPEGDRVLDAPYVFADIDAYTRQLKEEAAWEKNDRNAITIFKSGEITIVIAALKKGAEIVDKKVDGFMSIQVLSGNVNVITSEGDGEAEQHSIFAFHPGITYAVKAMEEAVVLITNYSKNTSESDSIF